MLASFFRFNVDSIIRYEQLFAGLIRYSKKQSQYTRQLLRREGLILGYLPDPAERVRNLSILNAGQSIVQLLGEFNDTTIANRDVFPFIIQNSYRSAYRFPYCNMRSRRICLLFNKSIMIASENLRGTFLSLKCHKMKNSKI